MRSLHTKLDLSYLITHYKLIITRLFYLKTRAAISLLCLAWASWLTLVYTVYHNHLASRVEQTGRLGCGPAWPSLPGKQSTGQTEPRRLNKQRAFDIFDEVAANREVFDEEENVMNVFSTTDNL